MEQHYQIAIVGVEVEWNGDIFTHNSCYILVQLQRVDLGKQVPVEFSKFC